MRQQPRLDLAQLDAEAADLHLEVVAAQELDVAVGTPAPQIARPVQPRARLAANGSATKRSRRQLRPVQIAARHARAADVELARHADRHRLRRDASRM